MDVSPLPPFACPSPPHHPWTPRHEWTAAHATGDVVYRVVLASPRWSARLWSALRAAHRTEGDVVSLGGAYVGASESGEIEVVSAGEDALDALDYAINDVLVGALEPGHDLRVRDEEIAPLNLPPN